MKNLDRASVSHDEALVRELRADPAYAAEYLQAAMEDTGEPAVLLIALRRGLRGLRHGRCRQGRRHQTGKSVSRPVAQGEPDA